MKNILIGIRLCRPPRKVPSFPVRYTHCGVVSAGLLFGGVKYGLVPQDPMLLFVLLMQSCMPSAQNSVIMLQVTKNIGSHPVAAFSKA